MNLSTNYWFCMVLIAALSACSSEQQRPTPPPPPPQTPTPPPQAKMAPRDVQQQTSQSAATSLASPGSQQAPSAQPSAAAAQAGDDIPPPSSAETDVEITDIPVDENGDPIIEQSPPKNASAQNKQAPSKLPGGGGTTAAPSGANDSASGGSIAPQTPVNTETGPVVNIGAMTDAERGSQLEQNLSAKLAEFDELIRRAREDAERDRASGGGSSGSGGSYAGSANGQGARQNPPPDGPGAGGQADTASGLGQTPDLSGSDRQGRYSRTAGAIPNDIPFGRDDDIVARQLREAATRESDPVLREKLWDEYRKYTKGIGH